MELISTNSDFTARWGFSDMGRRAKQLNRSARDGNGVSGCLFSGLMSYDSWSVMLRKGSEYWDCPKKFPGILRLCWTKIWKNRTKLGLVGVIGAKATATFCESVEEASTDGPSYLRAERNSQQPAPAHSLAEWPVWFNDLENLWWNFNLRSVVSTVAAKMELGRKHAGLFRRDEDMWNTADQLERPLLEQSHCISQVRYLSNSNSECLHFFIAVSLDGFRGKL